MRSGISCQDNDQDNVQDVNDAWLAPREAALLLGLPVEAARKRAERGTIRARNVDKGWRVALLAEMDTRLGSDLDAPHVS